MFRTIVKDAKIKGYAQPLNIEVIVLQITFTEGLCQVQFEIRPEPAPVAEGETPIALAAIKAGTTDIVPAPPKLVAALQGAFAAYLPSMLEKIG